MRANPSRADISPRWSNTLDEGEKETVFGRGGRTGEEYHEDQGRVDQGQGSVAGVAPRSVFGNLR